ncbi:MAG: hypothetical protein HUU21_07070 [Polyangiaceae bacterium]|nr:hypothetical protein [Polyangiaceae bacterium]
MALVILGKTLCSICRLPLMMDDKIVSFSPFVANRRDPLFQFSDAAFHQACFARNPLAEAALRRSEEVRVRGAPGSRPCEVCGQQIKDPDEYFGVGFLTDDPASPVFGFNYLQFHRTHFSQWERAREFRRLMEAFLSSDGSEGPFITFDPFPHWVVPV